MDLRGPADPRFAPCRFQIPPFTVRLGGRACVYFECVCVCVCVQLFFKRIVCFCVGVSFLIESVFVCVRVFL